jgi:DNA-binding HxlR family transcriptional regulator
MQQLARPTLLHIPPILADDRSLRIIGALTAGCQRYTQLQRATAMSSKTLAARLKRLEADALVTRTLYAQVPLRVEYELTEKGYELVQLLHEFTDWEKKWA